MKLKQIVSATFAAALLLAGVGVTPAVAHGQIKKEVILFDASYFEIGRILHYCDGHVELVGSSDGGVFQEVYTYSCN